MWLNVVVGCAMAYTAAGWALCRRLRRGSATKKKVSPLSENYWDRAHHIAYLLTSRVGQLPLTGYVDTDFVPNFFIRDDVQT
jgi:hypothetical protein